MAFARLEHLLLVVVPDAHPRVGGAAGDELALAAVEGDAGDVGGHADGFEQVGGLEGVEEVDAFAGGDGEDACGVRGGSGGGSGGVTGGVTGGAGVVVVVVVGAGIIIIGIVSVVVVARIR